MQELDALLTLKKQYFDTLCKWPAVVVQLETLSRRVFPETAEGVWLRYAKIVLSLRHRGVLSLVAPDRTNRRSIGA